MNTLDNDLEVLRIYFETTSKLDIQGVLATFHDDIVVEAPFTPEILPLVPRRMDGKAAIAALYNALPGLVAPLNMSDINIEPLQKLGEYICTYKGNSRMLATGLPYRNRYISRISMKDGKIIYFYEYYDAIELLVAVGGSVTLPQALVKQ